jgi:hypothetical protein
MANLSKVYFLAKGSGTGSVLGFFTASDAVVVSGTAALSRGLNNHPLIDFGLVGPASVDFDGVFPAVPALKVSLYWAANVPAGFVNWLVEFERNVAPSNLAVDSFGVIKNGLAGAPLVVGELTKTTISFTSAEADSLLPGEPYRLRVSRFPLAFPDTLAGVAQLYRVVLEAP